MINIHVMQDLAYVWNAQDAMNLREDHRIVGQLIGALPRAPYQSDFMGLPLQLLPEEATLLKNEGIARLVSYLCLSEPPSDEKKHRMKQIREDSYWEQVRVAHEDRKNQIIQNTQNIIDGKRKKLEQKGGSKDIDVEEAVQDEIDKIPMLPRNQAVVQQFTADPHITEEDALPAKWMFPSSDAETVRYRVFSHLWKQGFYLTTGAKFGGDFLFTQETL